MFINLGRRHWEMTRDAEGHRDYKIVHRVGYGSVYDGPSTAMVTPGLPFPGAVWAIDNDVDLWATCRWDARVTPVVSNEPGRFFDVEQNFSTKLPQTGNCRNAQVENPLLEPMKVSGSFVKYQEEATHDRFGLPVLTSSHEPVRGHNMEFDASRLQIKIEQNVALLGLELFASMIDHVNELPLWGLVPRTIKLSNVSWERKYWGQCSVYYTRNFEFEIRFDGFDRWALDEGTKALKGHWNAEHQWVLDPINGHPPNPKNPTHFKRYTDPDGNMTRVVLDGNGKPFSPEDTAGVSECDQCLGGAPTVWRVGGIVNSDGTAVRLEHGNTCFWGGTWTSEKYGARAVTLSYKPPEPILPGEKQFDDVWTLIIQDVDNQWQQSGKLWECFGSNTLSGQQTLDLLLNNSDIPQNLNVSAGSLPGEFLIQKYDEADFLLLGIPIVF